MCGQGAGPGSKSRKQAGVSLSAFRERVAGGGEGEQRVYEVCGQGLQGGMWSDVGNRTEACFLVPWGVGLVPDEGVGGGGPFGKSPSPPRPLIRLPEHRTCI